MKNPARNPLYPHGVLEYIRQDRQVPDFDFRQHEQVHAPKVLVYTSTATITTTAGSRLYPIRPGRLIRAQVNVQTAPTSTMTWTLLKNGTSVFTTNPTLSNESGSFPVVDDPVEYIDNADFLVSDYFQFQVTTVGGAGGPLVGVLEYIPADFY